MQPFRLIGPVEFVPRVQVFRSVFDHKVRQTQYWEGYVGTVRMSRETLQDGRVEETGAIWMPNFFVLPLRNVR
jgi:hypothetical protein